MTFDDFSRQTMRLEMSGLELASLYSSLLEREDGLDPVQRRALDALRQVMYGHFSIEEMELVAERYGAYVKGWLA